MKRVNRSAVSSYLILHVVLLAVGYPVAEEELGENDLQGDVPEIKYEPLVGPLGFHQTFEDFKKILHLSRPWPYFIKPANHDDANFVGGVPFVQDDLLQSDLGPDSPIFYVPDNNFPSLANVFQNPRRDALEPLNINWQSPVMSRETIEPLNLNLQPPAKSFLPVLSRELQPPEHPFAHVEDQGEVKASEVDFAPIKRHLTPPEV